MRRSGRYDQLDTIWVADIQVGAKGMVLADGRRWPVTELADPDLRRLRVWAGVDWA